MGVPAVVAVEKAKSEVRMAVVKAQSENNLPAHLMASILTEILYDCKLVAVNEFTMALMKPQEGEMDNGDIDSGESTD